MNYTTWIFLSVILAVAMIWVFVLEFANNFNEDEELERLVCESSVRGTDLMCRRKSK